MWKWREFGFPGRKRKPKPMPPHNDGFRPFQHTQSRRRKTAQSDPSLIQRARASAGARARARDREREREREKEGGRERDY